MSGHPQSPRRYKVCIRCGKRRLAKNISARGLCRECSFKAIVENIKSMKSKSGPSWEKWKMAMLRYVSSLIDESETNEVESGGSAKRGKARK